MNKRYTQVYAVVRVDWYIPDTEIEMKVTVKEIVSSQAVAEKEVLRLNHLNKDKDCSYFWQHTKLYHSDMSAEGNEEVACESL